ncbi:MAG: membrane protease YdiL (CAAX protease family) [Cyclobacteriaceae bacterium]|jgi:membrane protease YdiL (CAAX protease family)
MRTATIKSKTKLLIEIIIVLGVMSGTKAICDQIQIIPSGVTGSIGIWLGIFVATFFFNKRNIKWSEIGLRLPKGRKEWLNQLGVGLLAIGSIILITFITLFVLKPLFGLEKAADATDKFSFFLGKPLVLIVYIIVGIWFGAGLGEELLMRGFILNTLKQFIGNSKISWALALIIQAVLFGFMHSYHGSQGMVITGLIALSFGIFYLVTQRKLFPVVFAYAAFDTLTMVGFYFSESDD